MLLTVITSNFGTSSLLSVLTFRVHINIALCPWSILVFSWLNSLRSLKDTSKILISLKYKISINSKRNYFVINRKINSNYKARLKDK